MNNFNHVKRFILTGTPSNVKTSVIKELKKLGYFVIHQSATGVISQKQVKVTENS